MKATFFSVLALAMSAFAAPTAQPGLAVRDVKDVQNAVKGTEGTAIQKTGAEQIVKGATKTPTKRAVTNVKEVIITLQSTVTTIKSQQKTISVIITKVKSGEITKNEAADQSATQFQNMHYTLTTVVTKLTGASGLTVADVDVDTVLNLVVNLVSIVLATVKTVVTVLGVQPQLNSILHSVLSILSNVLILVTGLVVAIVPGLVAALTPLLAGLGNGLLAPILTPVSGVVAGLSGSI